MTDALLCWGTRQLRSSTVGREVFVATEQGAIEYHRARVLRRTATQVEVERLDVVEGTPPETLDLRSSRLWHGTHDAGAWEVPPLRPPTLPL